MFSKIYHVTWDSDDARFQYANNTYWSSRYNFLANLADWMKNNEKYLETVWYDTDQYDNGDSKEENDFEYWKEWCVENFCYIEEIKLQDNRY